MVSLKSHADPILPDHTSAEITWIFNDGGRIISGLKGHHQFKAGDCVIRAIALAGDYDYRAVRRFIRECIGIADERGWYDDRPRRCHPDRGVCWGIYARVLAVAGFDWCRAPVGVSRLVHVPSQGRLVVRMTRHLCAVIDGEAHDVDHHDRRRVYGWWVKAREPDEDFMAYMEMHRQY